MQQVLIDISLIVAASALLAWLAIVLRQPIIIAYVGCGMLAGPWGLGLVSSTEFIDAVSQFGIMLLLFHAGVVLHPRRLRDLALKTTVVTLGQCLFSLAVVFAIGMVTGFGPSASLYLGLALMFTSTVLVIKLMPTVALHHQYMGAFAIAILILEDVLALAVIMLLSSRGSPLLLLLKGIAVVALSLIWEQWILRRMMLTVERFREILLLLSLGWALGLALLSQAIGFSPEVAAFVAGVALARSPLSLFLSESLRQFRDFFLVFFFFVLGARMNPAGIGNIIWIVGILALVLMLVKYLSFNLLFRLMGEDGRFSREAGLRLSQASEFALIIAFVAQQSGRLDGRFVSIIMLTTLATMVISSYLVVFLLPTPLGITESMKQD